MGHLDGKRIVVTGAFSGMGRGFAVALAEAGASVVVNGTNAEKLAETVAMVEAVGGRCASVLGSVADDDLCGRIVTACCEQFGGIDVAINNAGVALDRTLLKMTMEQFDESVAINLRGTFSVSRHAAKAMVEQGTGGLLLHVTSVAAFLGSVGQSNYAASKAGQLGLMYAWSKELARYDIRCNALSPAGITDMTKVVFDQAAAAAVAEGRTPPTPAELGFAEPEDIAPVVVYLCSDAAAHLNTQFVTFTGRKVAIWRHPKESASAKRDRWTYEDFVAEFPGPPEKPARPSR